jgi:hypothetical protein
MKVTRNTLSEVAPTPAKQIPRLLQSLVVKLGSGAHWAETTLAWRGSNSMKGWARTSASLTCAIWGLSRELADLGGGEAFVTNFMVSRRRVDYFFCGGG